MQHELLSTNGGDGINRRRFLKGLTIGAGIALLPSAGAFAKVLDDNILAFRQNQSLLRLHYNENSLGMSAKAVEAAKQALSLYGNIYQVDAVDALTSALASKNKLPESQVFLGNGSTEILGLVVSYAYALGATLIEPSPTFGDVRGRAEARNMKVVRVALENDFVTNIEALKRAASKVSGPVLINICNPNNPTGTICDKDALTNWILTAPDDYVFLIDEAYHEYAVSNAKYESALSLIQDGKENVVVARTFSKVYGMAGMRVGYGFAAPKTAAKLNKYAASFNLSAAGLAAAITSLDDEEFLQTSIKSNQESKAHLTKTLDRLALPYIPSDTNFVLHRINADLQSYSKKMLANNIKVGRRMTAEDGWNRLSLGQPEEMRIFTQTLEAFRENGWV